MKKALIIAAALVVAVPGLVFGQSEGYYDRSYTRLSYIKGDVYIQRAQDLGFEQGEVNLVIVEGDKIGTRDGRAEIQLGRGNFLRLDRDTQVNMVGLPGQEYDPTKLHLLSGSLFLRVGSLDREKNIEIHTPDASFYILDEGLYRVDNRGNQETEFSVLGGQAEAAGEEGSVLVQDGETIVAANGRITSGPVGLRARGDDFNVWNETRDNLMARRTSQSYLPAEYADYESELSDNGRWVYESDYGNVWVPNVTYSDWRPYYNGRWSWYPIIGWTWISYEPWGWSTYHYGRWGWRFGLGWYWIPHNHWNWGPAWVHWWHGNDHLGWCPLSYYNYPGVIANNYFYNRYDRGYFPNNSRSLIVVHKNQLQNRRISQVALGQNAINSVGRISLRSAQPDLRPSLNRDNDIALRAQRVLSKEGLRPVNRGFANDGRRLSSASLRSSTAPRAVDRPAGGAGVSPGRVVNGRESGQAAAGGNPVRRIDRPSAGDPATGAPSRVVTERAIRPRNQEGSAGSSAPRVSGRAGTESGPVRNVERDGTRVFPSRREPGASPARTSESGGRVINPERGLSTPGSTRPAQTERGTSSSEPRKVVKRDRDSAGGAIPRYESRSLSAPRTSAPTTNSSGRGLSSVIRTRPSSPAVRSSSPSRSVNTPSRTVTAPRNTNAPSRSYSAPSRSSSSPSRSYSAPSRSSSAPSRSLSTPSRSSSAPSRSYSAPSRSSSSPSRSYSAPSRSSSAPSRSLSAPSRSSNVPSRSTSAPSRSYSAPSRSSSAPSRSLSTPSRSSSAPSRSYSAPSRSSSSPSRSSASPSRGSSAPSRSSSGGSSSRSSGGSIRRK